MKLKQSESDCSVQLGDQASRADRRLEQQVESLEYNLKMAKSDAVMWRGEAKSYQDQYFECYRNAASPLAHSRGQRSAEDTTEVPLYVCPPVIQNYCDQNGSMGSYFSLFNGPNPIMAQFYADRVVEFLTITEAYDVDAHYELDFDRLVQIGSTEDYRKSLGFVNVFFYDFRLITKRF